MSETNDPTLPNDSLKSLMAPVTKPEPKVFDPTVAERIALAAVEAEIKRLQAQGGELLREMKARVGLIGDNWELRFDNGRVVATQITG